MEKETFKIVLSKYSELKFEEEYNKNNENLNKIPAIQNKDGFIKVFSWMHLRRREASKLYNWYKNTIHAKINREHKSEYGRLAAKARKALTIQMRVGGFEGKISISAIDNTIYHDYADEITKTEERLEKSELILEDLQSLVSAWSDKINNFRAILNSSNYGGNQ